ncbi:MAG: hypothetical protein CMH56_06705 [Myxococcales bacterium]|nr:hypothetical protein [Myxococcales bacterium]
MAEEPACGDGFLASDEECDDGNTQLELCPYGVSSCEVCTPECAIEDGVTRKCGDGAVQDAFENCDHNGQLELDCDYGQTSCEVCLPHCTLGAGRTSFCGDGLIDNAHDEVCDPEHPRYKQCPYGEVRCLSCNDQCAFEIITGPVCGDGIVQEEHEGCDDGNQITERCSADLTTCMVCNEQCQWEEGESTFCGDGQVDTEWGEECDDGNSGGITCPYGEVCDFCNDACQWAEAQGPYCGDAVIQTPMGENCDDGNGVTESCPYGTSACLVCSENCQTQAGQTAFCGDFLLQPQHDEKCDQGINNGAPCAYGTRNCIACNESCQWAETQGPYCGDGEVADEEECDDGNAITERCDYASGPCQVCNASCQWETLPGTACGDGNVDVLEGETCDDGNSITEDCPYGHVSCTVCTETCQWGEGNASFCGDGVHQALEGESCDESTQGIESCIYGDPSCVVCAQNCRYRLIQGPFCGDGITQTSQGEQCDLGPEPPTECPYGTPNCERCLDDCKRDQTTGPYCGDGIHQEAYETCDHGIRAAKDCAYNAANDPTSTCTICNAFCEHETVTPPACGDGYLDSQHGEECDDGNNALETCLYSQTSCAVCNASCLWENGATSFCGDGLISDEENCEDGNNITETCENGINDCQTCTTYCQTGAGRIPECGDGVIDEPNESCDLASENGYAQCAYGLVACEVCNELCEIQAGVATYCGDGIVQDTEETCEDGIDGLPPNSHCAQCEYACHADPDWRFYLNQNDDWSDGCERSLWAQSLNSTAESFYVDAQSLPSGETLLLTQSNDEGLLSRIDLSGEMVQEVFFRSSFPNGTATTTMAALQPHQGGTPIFLGHACQTDNDQTGLPCTFTISDTSGGNDTLATAYFETHANGTPFSAYQDVNGTWNISFLFPTNATDNLNWVEGPTQNYGETAALMLDCQGTFAISASAQIDCDDVSGQLRDPAHGFAPLAGSTAFENGPNNSLMILTDSRWVQDASGPNDAIWHVYESDQNDFNPTETWRLHGDNLTFSFQDGLTNTNADHWRTYFVHNDGDSASTIQIESCETDSDAGSNCQAVVQPCFTWTLEAGASAMVGLALHQLEQCEGHFFQAFADGTPNSALLFHLPDEESFGLLAQYNTGGDTWIHEIKTHAPENSIVTTTLQTTGLQNISALNAVEGGILFLRGPISNDAVLFALDYFDTSGASSQLETCDQCTERDGLFKIRLPANTD